MAADEGLFHCGPENISNSRTRQLFTKAASLWFSHLMRAVMKYELSEVNRLLEIDDIVRHINDSLDGQTALHLAVDGYDKHRGSLQIINALLAKADQGECDAVNALLNKSPSPYTPETLQALLEKSTDQNVVEILHNRLPPFMHSFRCHRPIRNERTKRQFPNTLNDLYYSYLMKAVMEYNVEHVKQLLSSPNVVQRINDPMHGGQTALHLAVRGYHKDSNSLQIINILLAKGAEDQADVEGKHALFAAATQGEHDAVDALLSKSPSPYTPETLRAIMAACTDRNVVKRLHDTGCFGFTFSEVEKMITGILVAAALFATIGFSSLAVPFKPSVGRPTIQVFTFFNGLTFYLAVATINVSLILIFGGTSVGTQDPYLAAVTVFFAAMLFFGCISFTLGCFSSALVGTSTGLNVATALLGYIPVLGSLGALIISPGVQRVFRLYGLRKRGYKAFAWT